MVPSRGDTSSSSQGGESTISDLILQDSPSQETRARLKKADIDGFNDIFISSWNESRQQETTCLHCSQKLITNRHIRWESHVRRCDKIPEHIAERFLTSCASLNLVRRDKVSDEYNIRFGEVMIETGLHLALLRSKRFRDLMRDICPKWKMASSEEMSSYYFARICSNVEKDYAQLISETKDYSLSIEYDHWSDINGQSLFGVAVTSGNGRSYLHSLDNVTMDGHATEAILMPLKRSMSALPSKKINSVISDSASSCKAAREQLVCDLEWSHVIEHRCIAHLLNRVAHLIGRDIDYLIESASQLSNFIRNDAILCSLLKQVGICKPTKAVETRWYSHVTMLEGLVLAEEELEQNVELGKIRNAKAVAMILDKDFWLEAQCSLIVLRPLANCIATAERHDGSVGEAFAAILEFAKTLDSAYASNKHICLAKEALYKYLSTDKLREEFGLMLACYFLDRRYCMSYVTREGINLVFRTVCTLAQRTGLQSVIIEGSLTQNFKEYCRQEGDLSRKATSESAEVWWSAQSSMYPLRLIALRLANLKSSSANLERIWSCMRHLQSPAKTNFSHQTLVRIMKSKTFLKSYGDYAAATDIPRKEDSLNHSVDSSVLDSNPLDGGDLPICESQLSFQRYIDFSIQPIMKENTVHVVSSGDSIEDAIARFAVEQLH